jgi:hypothetical protein
MRSRLLALSALLLLTMPAFAHKHERYGEGLSVDLDVPYEKAVKAVQAVADNGVIRGTWQFRGTSELDLANSAKTASGFKSWDGKGSVFYKVRPDAIAPQHFYDSGDQGTVSVRYIVEDGGPNLTHLRIDAVYQEKDGNRTHPSDGQVENSEFAVITKQLEDFDAAEKKQREKAALKAQEEQLESLQSQLQQENAALAAARAKQARLEQEVKERNGIRLAHVHTSTADVKSRPYTASKTVCSLARGDAVMVSAQAASWYKVQAGDGREGWIYSLMLDVAP